MVIRCTEGREQGAQSSDRMFFFVIASSDKKGEEGEVKILLTGDGFLCIDAKKKKNQNQK